MASIGSSTITGRPTSDSGSDAMYGVGSWVCSSRASPTKPICDSGSRLNAASAMPRPARSTGTSSGGLASAVPTVGATGVVIGTSVRARPRVAS